MEALAEKFQFGGSVVVRVEKVALVAPAGTVTVGGTVTMSGRALRSETTIPPAGAGPLSLIVPVACVPVCTVSGVTLNPTRPTVAVLESAIRVMNASSWCSKPPALLGWYAPDVVGNSNELVVPAI